MAEIRLPKSSSSTAPGLPWRSTTGAFADVSAIDLGVHAAREALARSGTEPGEIDHVIFGNALQTSGDAIYGARHVGLKAGVPKEVPALTVNRLCGSGFESIVQGAHRILLGEAKTVLAGGMENMSQAPHVIRGARKGLRLGQGQLEDSLMVALLDSLLRPLHGADLRPRGGEVRHHPRGAGRVRALLAAARRGGMGRRAASRKRSCPSRSRPGARRSASRRTTTCGRTRRSRASRRCRPRSAKDGQVTAGNASGIVDGAAAVVVTSAANAQAKGRKPLGRLVSWAVVGRRARADGARSGSRRARRRSRRRALKPEDIGLWEINEAFAGQILGRRPRARPRPREVERQRRRDRARPSAGRDGHALHPDAAEGDAPARRALRPRRRVHRRRPGHRGRRRVGRLARTRRAALNWTERILEFPGPRGGRGRLPARPARARNGGPERRDGDAERGRALPAGPGLLDRKRLDRGRAERAD